jgi:hypothetical protein
MLRRLKDALQNYLASLPKSEVVDSIPPDQWAGVGPGFEVPKAKRRAFADLLALAYSHLPAEKSEQLVAQGARSLDNPDSAGGDLYAALVPEEDNEAASRGFIACDWKAADEVGWQADLLCRAHHIPPGWAPAAGSGLSEQFDSFDSWLRNRGRQLLCFSPGDCVVAFAVRQELAPKAVSLAKKLGIRLGRASEA